ncbi:MAG: metal-dependent phosphohydrolase [Planctomycetaceae bacterium]|nr:metal-dependent phosphohydrolase [Planctomycetaceae bacterium]
MSTSQPPRTRSDLTASLRLPKSPLSSTVSYLRRSDVLLRLLLCLLAAVVMWGATTGWKPPLPFASGYTPVRDIVARIDFSTVTKDGPENERRRQRAEAQTVCVYEHDVQPLVELRNALKNRVFLVRDAESLEALNTQDPAVWTEFLDAQNSPADEVKERWFSDFREALAADTDLANFERGVQNAFADYERDGLLQQLEHQLEDGSQSAILLHPIGNTEFTHRVEVEQVRITQATADLQERLNNGFQAAGLPEQHVETTAELTYNWLMGKKLPATLRIDIDASKQARDESVDAIEVAFISYQAGDRLVAAGKPLTKDDVESLEAEEKTIANTSSFAGKIWHTLAAFGMYFAMYVLCGTYLFFHDRRVLTDTRRLAAILGVVVVTVALGALAADDDWRAETIPTTLFGITVAIAYQRELALLLSAVVSLIVTLSVGHSLAECVILVSTVSSAILLVGRVRSRTKLLYVGLGAAAVAVLTTVGVGTLVGQAYGWSGTSGFGAFSDWIGDSFAWRLLGGALWHGFSAILAGVLMTGLLPFIERLFDVQTDISLLELGDAAHPLLQELVRRAPGTYNHSINVASIAEAAADTIGANGLLCRVGAYFHDIGKMLKPGYFIENQGSDGNRHESLMPAMSTLVIIAHVKDGADLAKQHRLPRAIIDFIEQHHGTTLVEYFYNQAAKKREGDPDAADVDETSFRYPGPKPQTKESGVMMLADASESACRTLSDPAPARIEHLVHEIAMKRLLDGQFDDCNLTLRELAVVEDSIVKSLTAVYHGRVKYPNQQPA